MLNAKHRHKGLQIVRFCLYEVPNIEKSMETRSRFPIACIWGKWKDSGDGQKVWGFFWDDENILKLVVVMDVQLGKY